MNISKEEFERLYMIGNRKVWDCRRCADLISLCRSDPQACDKRVKPEFAQMAAEVEKKLQAQYQDAQNSVSNTLNKKQSEIVGTVSSIISSWLGTNDFLSQDIEKYINDSLFKRSLDGTLTDMQVIILEEAIVNLLNEIRKVGP